MKKFNKKNVKAWMKDNHQSHCDPITKEVNFTTLCEAVILTIGYEGYHVIECPSLWYGAIKTPDDKIRKANRG